MLKEYYKLAKPGIIYGNLVTTVAAFFFATGWHIPLAILPYAIEVFAATVVGLGLVIGSACVFNNYLDRNIDSKMERTKNRALVTGKITARNALLYGAMLGIVGIALLASFVNFLTAGIALFGWLMYVLVYSPLKHRSWTAAMVGSIPGAVPIVVGYTAVTGQFDLAALLLFLILVVWQMPHFYAIAMYRLDEYKAAGIPTLPARLGMLSAKIQTVLFIVLFMAFTLVLTFFHYTGYVYAAILLALGAAWLWRSLGGFGKEVANNKAAEAKWARGVFLFSLIVLMGFSVVLAVSPLLP